MNDLLKTSIKNITKNWTALFFFEILYKILGAVLLGNLFDLMVDIILKSSGFSSINQSNFLLIFGNPLTPALFALFIILVTYYIYIDFSALVLYCETSWNKERLSFYGLVKKAFKASLGLFNYKNWPFMLIFILLVIFSIFPLTNGLFNDIKIPEFIVEYIQLNPILFACYIGIVILANLFLTFLLFCLPDIILKKETFLSIWRKVLSSLRRKKIKTLAILFFSYCIFLCVALCVAVFAILLLVAGSKLFSSSANDALSTFQFYYLKLSSMGKILMGIFTPVWFVSLIVTLSHTYRGDPKPIAFKTRPKASTILLRIISVIISFFVLGMFSETELGGYYPSSDTSNIKIVAHRAGATFAPENTIAALNKAIEAQADMAEIDIQETSDHVLIVMHDSNFKRTTGLDQNVWETDYATVKSLDTGSSYSLDFTGEPIPTLEKMLDAAKNKIHLMIELKSTGHEENLEEKTIDLIRQHGMENQCSIASMDQNILKRSKEIAPEIKTVYITTLLFADLYNISYIDSYSVETTFLTRGLIAQAHYENKKVYVWTANKEKNILKIIDYKADGLITDNPELARYYINNFDKNFLLEFLSQLFF